MDGRTIPSYYALVTKKRFAPPKSNFVQVVTGQTLLASLDSWNWFALPAARSESMTKESMTTPTRQFKERMARSVLNARILKSLMGADLLTPIEAVQAHILIQKALETTDAERAKRDRAITDEIRKQIKLNSSDWGTMLSSKNDVESANKALVWVLSLMKAALKEQETGKP